MNTTAASINPELTIVIPAKNERKLIPFLLGSLASQDYSPIGNTKIYVADANSTDGTLETVLAFRDRLDVEVVPGGLPSAGRNSGARRARSRYVLFLDADIQITDPTLIRRALETMERKQLHCLTTNIWCNSGRLLDNIVYAGNNLVQYLSIIGRPFSTGMFMLFRRDRFEALGGFNERAMFAEDYLLSGQVACRRFRVIRGGILTTDRRFQKTGRMHMILLFFWTMLNTWNKRYYERDHNYWEEEAPIEQGA